MKNKFLQLCINWWAGEESPRWLRSVSNGDPKLVKYEEELNSLSRLLRDDADDWAEREVSETGSTKPRSWVVQLRESKGSRIRFAAAAALAVSLAVLLLAWNADSLFHRAEPPVSKRIAATDARRLSDGLNSIIGALDESLIEIRDSASTLPQLAEDAAEATSSDIRTICGPAKSQFEFASRSYGQALALIEKSARSQIGEEN